MKTSARGLEDLCLSEGLRLSAYRDSAGVWTVGYGHTASAGPPAPKAGMKITVAEAKAILARDLAKFEARVNREFPSGLPQHVFDGAVSFDFNTGAINRASWVDDYKSGMMQKAEAALKSWNKATVNGKRVTIKGLVTRRQHEADLIFRGKYRSGPAAPVVPAKPDTGTVIKEAQTRLRDLGYFEVGKPDGLMGSRTRGALLAFKADWNDANPTKRLPLDDKIDDATLAALMAAKPRAVSPEREAATESVVADRPTVQASNKVGLVAKVGGAVAVAGGLVDTGALDQVEHVVGVGGRIKSALSDIGGVVGQFWWVALLVAGIAVFLWVRKIKAAEVDSYRTGKTT